jgi:hypothetical protein
MATPNFLLAADNHNIASSGSSWYNPLSWDINPANTGKFAAASILSGANSLYNTAAYAGNWLGADIQENDTASWISGMDSDLGQYYRQNKESTDLVGFIATSLIPGLGGVKAFQAGQLALKGATRYGMVGGSTSKIIGLLVPQTERFAKLAAADINASVGAAKLLNANTTKALASGVWQNTLESAAAESFVQAFMFRSPILEQQDFGDVLSNIAVGAAFGGVIGGAFSAVKTRSYIKGKIQEETIGREPLATRPQFSTITPAHERITGLAFDSEFSAVPVSIRGPGGEVVNNYAVNKQIYDTKLAKNYDEIRTAINGLSDDLVLGNLTANISMPVKGGESGFAQRYMENFNGVVGITKPGVITRIEAEAAKMAAKNEIPQIRPEARYVKIIGEGVGDMSTEAPLLKTAGDIYDGVKGVRSAVKEKGFKLADNWDASKLTGSKGYLEAELRHIWASEFVPEIPKGTVINANDIPLLERAYKDGVYADIKIIRTDGLNHEIVAINSPKQFYDFLREQKVNLANDLLKKFSLVKSGDIPIELGTEYAAKIVNTRKSYLEGTSAVNETDDIFSHQADYVAHLKALKDRGLSTDSTKAAEAVNPFYLPKTAKIVYDTQAASTTSQHIFDAVVEFKARQKVYEQGAKNVVAKIFGEASESLPDIRESSLRHSERVGAGPGLFSSENSNYGTIGSAMAWIGSVAKGLKDSFRSKTGKALESSLVKMGAKPETAIEFEGLSQKVSRSGKFWVTHEDNTGTYLITREMKKALDEGTIHDLPNEILQIKNPETWDAVRAHIAESGKVTTQFGEIRAAQGLEQKHDPNVFRPIRPDLKQYPHFAFVEDPRVTGSGHMTMIHAASEKELNELISKVPPEYRVRTKSDVENFYRARGEYEHSRTLNENYINSDLASKGVFSNFFPKSDPQKIINDILQHHYRESDVLVQETIRLRYENVFNFFEDMGKRTSQADTSRFASRLDIIEKTTDNPYFNYIKTALDISKASENKLIYGFNKLLDESVSKAVGSIKDTWFNKVKTQADLDTINGQLDQFGIKPAYYDAALQALANHTAPKGELTKFIRRGNSLLSLFTLGLDPLNALNNAIGSNILRFTELRHITDAISKGNTKVAGELASIAKVALPGTGDEIFSPSKLVAQAVKNYFSDMGAGGFREFRNDAGFLVKEVDKTRAGPLMETYRSEGIIKSRADQLKLLIDDFTLKGTESVSDLNTRMDGAVARLKSWSAKGEKLSLNAHAEEFNRFISANVMDQISDVAVRNGLMDAAEARAYRNTFVNRVEGNILASQRPLIFQGPIGQAISLFQSYQFNLLQQLFRYVGEGSKKDLAMLTGLQSTLYGIQSLPAFQFVNTHILGQLSGNKEHRDVYDATYGAAGKQAGNFLLYGLPSNFLQTNIYSRGDINPRQLTVIPTTLQEIPLVNGWGKFFLNLKETAGKIAGGGNVWQSVLQGIEHNGISRPLAGIAQTLQAAGPSGKVYSTFHLSTLSRLAGGKPLDDAISNDAFFRVKSYEAARTASMKSLAETVKSTLIQDEQSTPGQVNAFAQKYVELGGKQAGFNKWMMGLYKSANVSQADTLANSLKSPFAYKMQLLMGGGSDE